MQAHAPLLPTACPLRLHVDISVPHPTAFIKAQGVVWLWTAVVIRAEPGEAAVCWPDRRPAGLVKYKVLRLEVSHEHPGVGHCSDLIWQTAERMAEYLKLVDTAGRVEAVLRETGRALSKEVPAADEVTLSISYFAAALLRECSPEDYTAIAAAGGTIGPIFNNNGGLVMNWCFVLVYWLAFGDFVLMRCFIRSETVGGCRDAFQKYV